MITDAREYEKFLSQISESTPEVLKLRLPTDEPIYEIDWNSREVQAPQFIGVEGDHEAETIYFKMARYYELMDLSDTIGLISCKTAKGEDFWYIIPYYDIYTEPDYIIFPWVIQYPIAADKGKVSFAFKFIKISNIVTNDGQKLIYELNSRVATTQVLVGWANAHYTEKHLYKTIDPNTSILVTDELINKMNTIINTAQYTQIYWQDVGDISD